jgi:hypothetical protein
VHVGATFIADHHVAGEILAAGPLPCRCFYGKRAPVVSVTPPLSLSLSRCRVGPGVSAIGLVPAERAKPCAGPSRALGRAGVVGPTRVLFSVLFIYLMSVQTSKICMSCSRSLN